MARKSARDRSPEQGTGMAAQGSAKEPVRLVAAEVQAANVYEAKDAPGGVMLSFGLIDAEAEGVQFANASVFLPFGTFRELATGFGMVAKLNGWLAEAS